MEISQFCRPSDDRGRNVYSKRPNCVGRCGRFIWIRVSVSKVVGGLMRTMQLSRLGLGRCRARFRCTDKKTKEALLRARKRECRVPPSEREESKVETTRNIDNQTIRAKDDIDCKRAWMNEWMNDFLFASIALPVTEVKSKTLWINVGKEKERKEVSELFRNSFVATMKRLNQK